MESSSGVATKITEQEALKIARHIADENQWVWLEPVDVQLKQAGGLFSKSKLQIWHVTTNAKSRGANIWVQIDAESGQILKQAFNPR